MQAYSVVQLQAYYHRLCDISIDRVALARYDVGLRSVAQSGSAPGLGPGGPRFESLYSDQNLILLLFNKCDWQL